MTKKVVKAKSILIGALALVVLCIMATAAPASGANSKALNGNPGSVLLNAPNGHSPEAAGKQKKHRDKSGQGVKKSDKDKDKPKQNGAEKKKPARHHKQKKHQKHPKHHGCKGK